MIYLYVESYGKNSQVAHCIYNIVNTLYIMIFMAYLYFLVSGGGMFVFINTMKHTFNRYVSILLMYTVFFYSFISISFVMFLVVEHLLMKRCPEGTFLLCLVDFLTTFDQTDSSILCIRGICACNALSPACRDRQA